MNEQATVLEPPEPVLNYVPPMVRHGPRVWPAWTLIAIMLAYPFALGLVIGIALAVIARALRWSHVDFLHFVRDSAFRLALMAMLTFINIGIALAHQRLSRTVPVFVPLLRRPRASPINVALLCLGAVAFSQTIAFVSYYAHVHSSSLQSIAQIIATPGNIPPPLYLLLCLLVIGVLAPIGEEAVFRGAIQERLVRRYGVLPGILITSLTFGIFHFDLVQGTFAFLFGIYLGYLAHRSRSIVSSILAHAAVNISSTLMSVTHIHLISSRIEIPGIFIAALITLISVILLQRLPYLRQVRADNA